MQTRVPGTYAATDEYVLGAANSHVVLAETPDSVMEYNKDDP